MIYALVIGGFLAIAALLLAVEAVRIYNRLVKLDKHCDNAFSQIEVQLKRRYDLIPNLVETVRGYMDHERETLESVIAARNQASQQLKGAAGGKGGSMEKWIGAETALSGALGKMSFVMENYPDLKANESVAALTEELSSTENKIAFARQAYNDWCTSFNRFRQSFPNVLFAPQFGYTEDRTLLEFEDSAAIQAAPTVSFTAAEPATAGV